MCARRCTARICRRSAAPRPSRAKSGAPNDARRALADAIKAVLNDAIKAGGSSLRDHRQTDGELGYFQHSFRVYDREGDEMPDAGMQGHDQAHRAGHAVDVFLSGVPEANSRFIHARATARLEGGCASESERGCGVIFRGAPHPAHPLRCARHPLPVTGRG